MKNITVYPKGIIKNENVENINILFNKQPLQIGINEKNLIKFNSKSFLIIDFGEELKGELRILSFMGNTNVRIRYGESVSETCSEINEKNSTNDHATRDFYVNIPNYSDMLLYNGGFRFVRIDVAEGELLVKSIVVKAEVFNKKSIYQYKGKDLLIKNIFDCAKRTVDLCACSDYIWDGIKRDRLVWYGDLHPEMLALTTLYGKTKQVENSIDLARIEYKLPGWLNNFPSYSMWWICVVCDYFKMTHSTSFVRKQIKYINGLLSMMDKCVDDKGEMHYPFYFTDWPTYETESAKEGVRAINIISLYKIIELFSVLGIDNLVAKNLLNKLIKKDIVTYDKKQIIALKCLAYNNTTKEDYEKLIQNGAEGFSTFMCYYILKAIAKYNKEMAIKLMKEYYGQMLQLGATTFWEDFDVKWAKNSCKIDEFPLKGKKDIHGDFGAYCYKGFRHSLCHGWSAGVIAFIKEECDIQN